MSEAATNVTTLPTTKHKKAAEPKRPIDTQKIAVMLAVVMGLFGGGSYAVSPWATSSDLSSVKAEIKTLKKSDKLREKQLKAIAEKIGAVIIEEEPDDSDDQEPSAE